MRIVPVDLLSALHRTSLFLLLLQPFLVPFVLLLLLHCSGREIGRFCVAVRGSAGFRSRLFDVNVASTVNISHCKEAVGCVGDERLRIQLSLRLLSNRLSLVRVLELNVISVGDDNTMWI